MIMRSSSTAESTVRKSSVSRVRKSGARGAGACSGPAAGLSSLRERGPRLRLSQWPQGSPRSPAMKSAASFDPYFTSCFAASILWHSLASSTLPSMRSRKKSMMRAPSSVLSRTMSAMVGGFRSVVVMSARVPLVWYIRAIMHEGWGCVKREIFTTEDTEGTEGGRGIMGEREIFTAEGAESAEREGGYEGKGEVSPQRTQRAQRGEGGLWGRGRGVMREGVER